MKMYIVTNYGIFKKEGKWVNREHHGKVQRFFRTRLGEEYSERMVRECLTEDQMHDFDQRKKNYRKTLLENNIMIHPEDAFIRDLPE